jgi:hypothetical protein
LNVWQEDIQASSGLLSTNANLALRGLTCSSMQNIPNESVPDMAAAYNANVMARHPHRLKTLPQSLRHCFLQAVRQYLASKVLIHYYE